MNYKVFRFNDFDWVAGKNFKDALNWYVNFTGLDEEEALDPSYAPYEDMPAYVILERSGNEDLEKDYLEDDEDSTLRVPAEIVLERDSKHENGKPFLFCSTEY